MSRRDGDGRSRPVGAGFSCPSPVGAGLGVSSSNGDGRSLPGVDRIDAFWETSVVSSSHGGGGPGPCVKIPAILASMAVMATTAAGKSATISARTADIPLAPSIVAVAAVTILASFAKSWAARALAAKTALLPIWRGCLTVQRPVVTAPTSQILGEVLRPKSQW